MRTANANKGMKKVNSLNDLLFDVQMIENTETETLSSCSHDVFVYPEGLEGNRTIKVQSCSDRYKVIPNSEIFPAIEQTLLENNVHFSATYNMVDFSRFYVEYVIEDQKFSYPVGKSDYVKPCIKVYHSYNGLSNYTIVVGYFRLVCSNGLVIAVEDMKQFNLKIGGKHTIKIVDSLNQLADILHMFEENSSVLSAITAKYNMLNNVVVTDVKTAIATTLEKTGIIAVDNKSLNTVNNIYDRITKELNNPTLEYDATTNWLLYNGINSYLNDNSLNVASPEKREATDQSVFEYLLQESRKQLKRKPEMV